MLRAYCKDWDGSPEVPRLSREELHHLVRVRRVRPGERIEILNGRGAIMRCSVTEALAKSLRLENLGIEQHPPLAYQIHLLVALPKGKIFSTLLQKTVELGVTEITPLVTDHAEVNPARLEKKSERWESLLIEGIKQSGNARIPVLNEACSLPDGIQRTAGASLRLCAALQPDADPLLKILNETEISAGTISVFVGPEGDFSNAEYQLLREAGSLFVTLGKQVLKVETAASLVVGAIGLWIQARQ